MHSKERRDKSKKSKKILISALLMLSILIIITATGLAQTLMGDVNGDGSIDVRDVIFIQRHVLNFITLTAQQRELADVNGDGLIDARDVTLVMQRAIGKITSFPLQVAKVDEVIITVPFGTSQANIGLPSTVSAMISDGVKRDISIQWETTSTPAYNSFTAGTYVFKGTLHDFPSGITNPDGLKATANVNVPSAWIPPQPVVFQVTFDSQGGTTPSPASIYVAFGSSYGTLPTVTRTGYTFDGWYTDSTGGTLIIPSTVVFIAANHTLYAQWTAITPEVTEVEILWSDDDKATWNEVAGDLENGYSLELDGSAVSLYYLTADDVESNIPLKDGDYGFYVDPTQQDSGYWATRGVVEGASGWQAVMWNIINGDAPIFYLRVSGAGTSFMLVDGLQKAMGSDGQYLRINGDYPTGEYTYTGIVRGVNDVDSEEIKATIEFTYAALTL
jgi:uncharacterized repeat protein (TIGR02543 family)